MQKPAISVIDPGDSFKAYFELSGDKDTLSINEEIEVKMWLYTTGENFEYAGGAIKWDPLMLDFVSAEANDLPGGEGHLDTSGSAAGMRIMAMFVSPGSSYMTTVGGSQTLFYTLTFKAKVDNPLTVIELLNTQGELVLHFVDSPSENNIDQSMAAAGSDQLQIGSVAPTITPTVIPTANPTPFPDLCGDDICQSFESFLTCPADCCAVSIGQGDLNKDCVINSLDWSVMHKYWTVL